MLGLLEVSKSIRDLFRDCPYLVRCQTCACHIGQQYPFVPKMVELFVANHQGHDLLAWEPMYEAA